MKDTRARRLLSNSAGMTVGKGASILVALVAVPLVVDAIGPAGFGMWAVCQMVVLWSQALDLGLGLGLQNEISHATDESMRRRASQAAGALRATMLVAAVLVGAVGFVCVWSWPSLLLIFGPESEEHASLGRFLLTMTVAGMMLMLVAQTPLRTVAGLEMSGRVSLAQAFGGITALLILWISTIYGQPLVGIGALMLLPALFQLIASLILLLKTEYAWARPTRNWASSDWWRLMSVGVWFFCSQAAAIVVFQTDAVIVSIQLGPVEAGVFQATTRIFGVILMFQGVLLVALWPSIARAWSAGDRTWVRITYHRYLILLAVAIPLIGILAVIAPQVVVLWTGSEDLRPSLILVAGCAVGCVATLWANLHATCLNSVGSVRLPAIVAIIQASINLTAVLIAVQWWGAVGVAWASAICALVTSVPILSYAWHVQRRKHITA